MESNTRFYDCFRTEKRFEDKVNFPYGFMKSGEFTIDQARLLELKGIAYSELASGFRRPKGEIEREFVAFCQGKKEASTSHEKVWQRYQKKVLASFNAVSFNKRRSDQPVLAEGSM